MDKVHVIASVWKVYRKGISLTKALDFIYSRPRQFYTFIAKLLKKNVLKL